MKPQTGTVTKILHHDQVCFAVIGSLASETDWHVRFIFAGELIEKDVTKEECRKPTQKQDDDLFRFIRQITGIPLIKPTDTEPTKAIGKAAVEDDEPLDPEEDN